MLHLIRKDMKEFLAGIFYSLRANPRRNSVIGLLVLLLVLSILGVTKEQSQTTQPMVQLGIIDEDASAYSQMFIEYFNNYDELQQYVQITVDVEDKIIKGFEKGIYDILVRIPKNFIEDMIYMNHTPVEVRINTEDSTKAIIINNILRSYEKYIRAVEIACVTLYDVMESSGYDADTIDKVNFKISYDLVFTALGKHDFFDLKPIMDYKSIPLLEYYGYGIIALLFLYAAIYGGYRLLMERKSQVFYRLKVTGIPVWKLVASKIISTTCFILLLGIPVAMFLSKGSIVVFGQLITFFIGFILCIVSIFLMVSTFFKNSTQYVMFSNILIFFWIVLGGGIIPTKFLPESLILISSYMPGYQFICKVYDLIHQGMAGEFPTLAYYVVGLVFLGISVISLKKKELSYAW